MTSQVSTLKLIKQEIRQNGWMFGLTTLAHFMTGPVVFLLNTSYYQNWTASNAHRRYCDYFTDTYFLWQLFTMIACICIAIFIYRYLFSKRMIDLYHSVPISRSQLFLVKYFHGFLIWFVPFAANGLCITLLFMIRSLGKPYLLNVLGAQLKSTALLIICFFIFYHLFLTAVYLSGNVINMFANTAIIGCSVLGFWSAGFSCAGNYFNTFAYTPSALLSDIIYGLSPFAAPFAFSNYFSSDVLFREHTPLIILSILITLGLLELSWILCLKRPSEMAERGTIFQKYTQPARIVVSILAGIAGALFFAAIVSGDQQLGWGIFGALLCSIVCFGAINSIFQATIKGFFKHKIQIILSAVISTFVILIFQLDLLGYDRYMPKKENLLGMAIYTHQLSDDSTYLYDINSYGGLGWERGSYVVQQEPMTDVDLCYDLLKKLVSSDKNGPFTNYYTKITLKNGRTYERIYQLPDNQYSAVAPFIESDSYKESNYKFSTGAFGYPAEITVDMWDAHFDVSGEELERIMDAYWMDFEEHYNLEELSSYIRVFDLSGQYGQDSDYAGNRWFSLDVHDNYERTLNVLAELYPEHKTAVTSAEEIKSLTMYADIYKWEASASNDYGLRYLYEYFGYELPEANAESDIRSESTEQAEAIEITTTDPIVVAVETASQIAAMSELTISDPKQLKELYPLLSFGNYRDLFDRKEYIYLGQITTNNHSTVSCYVKPGTLPEEIIQKLYDVRKEY